MQNSKKVAEEADKQILQTQRPPSQESKGDDMTSCACGQGIYVILLIKLFTSQMKMERRKMVTNAVNVRVFSITFVCSYMMEKFIAPDTTKTMLCQKLWWIIPLMYFLVNHYIPQSHL